MSTQSVLFDVPGPRARRRNAVIGVLGTLVVLALLGSIVWGLRQQLTPDMWAPFAELPTWTDYILPGLVATLEIAALSVLLAVVVGFALGIARLSHQAWIRWPVTCFVEFFRSVPVLVMMVFGYALFAGLGVQGTMLGRLSVLLGLSVYNSCVMAELIRAGVHSLPRGQREAGLAIGLTRQQTLTQIQLPQAVMAMLPSLLSQLVVILKDSALGQAVTYPELLSQLQNLSSLHSNVIAAFLVGALLFILVNSCLTWLAGLLERSLRTRRAGRMEPVRGDLVPDPDPDDELYTRSHAFESEDEHDRRTRPLR